MSEHKLLSKNLKYATGVCAVCGPVPLLRLNRGGACAIARRQQQGSNKYPLNDGTKMLVTPNRRREMLKDFGLNCGACGKDLDNNTARLDHCHETGKWRGVLCDDCNKGIGFLGDNLEGIMQAAAYLIAEQDG